MLKQTTQQGGDCPGRETCKKIDSAWLCRGCQFQAQSHGEWPEWIEWSKVEVDPDTFRILKDTTTPPENPARYNVWDEWIRHLSWLRSLREAGCQFRPNDLTPDEWRGLTLLEEEIIQLRIDAQKEKAAEDARRQSNDNGGSGWAAGGRISGQSF